VSRLPGKTICAFVVRFLAAIAVKLSTGGSPILSRHSQEMLWIRSNKKERMVSSVMTRISMIIIHYRQWRDLVPSRTAFLPPNQVHCDTNSNNDIILSAEKLIKITYHTHNL